MFILVGKSAVLRPSLLGLRAAVSLALSACRWYQSLGLTSSDYFRQDLNNENLECEANAECKANVAQSRSGLECLELKKHNRHKIFITHSTNHLTITLVIVSPCVSPWVVTQGVFFRFSRPTLRRFLQLFVGD